MSRKKGFTLIEVAIFLVITGALFVAVTVGVQNSIYQQRYNDSVQGFVDFLKNVYSSVTNTENLPGGGRSDKAIYGKLVTFGESKSPSNSEENYDENTIYVYNVIGDVNEEDAIGSGNALDILTALNADVAAADGDSSAKAFGIIESYTPRWAAQIQNTDNYNLFKGALLIVRHPSSGTVYTFAMKGEDETIEVNQRINATGIEGSYNNILMDYLNEKFFKLEQVDFCINPEGDEASTIRRDVRINANARNSSSISIVPNDSDNYACAVKSE
ncbi:prepilin-type N-terminal cleavage/methylation domain-containing protein [Candidatus Saccharibacteria bacterium]|nr:prepilin-type N-terminal cleavage/methylation domain-containing protein [Candidatus Saccharibacteria bacterium]